MHQLKNKQKFQKSKLNENSVEFHSREDWKVIFINNFLVV